MPSSRPYALSHICQRIIDLQPKTVLDIGIGFGKMGFLVREYTDVWSERYYSNGAVIRRTQIDGIEIFKEYIVQHHFYIYDNIYDLDAIDCFRLFGEEMPYYDLILCCDMLEHYTENNGTELLHCIRDNGKIAIITTPHPKAFTRQGAVYGNKHETHRHCWSIDDLAAWGEVTTFNNAMNLLEMR